MTDSPLPPGAPEPPTEPVRRPEPPTEPLRAPAGEPAEPPTEPVPTRWSGSAAIPPRPPGKGRRRGGDDPETLEMTAAEEAVWPPLPPPPQHNPNRPVTAVLPPGWGPDDVPPMPARKPPKPPRMRPPRGPVAYPGYPPMPPRRGRKWPWVLLFLTALTTLCCCGCVAWVKPLADQRATVAIPPERVAGLVRVQDTATTFALEADVRMHHWLAEDVFAVVYADPARGERRVTLFGATQFRWSPEQDLIRELDRLSQKLSLTDLAEADPGRLGGHMRCG
ncbi:MAG TPA: hypothetical protein VFM55_11320, partial [Micromonosporaceae bacterium]|nr:hypothetical protein [Micromonosporaceae bacterium]